VVELKVDSKSALALANIILSSMKEANMLISNIISSRTALRKGALVPDISPPMTSSLGRVKFQELCTRTGEVKINPKLEHMD